ncbi:MAG TPA: hypothetical protein VGK58_03650 [Lacipirellulaceae bacterium]
MFDRLVDGELSPAERRLLLASLDERPGGWRRCALAFLEAQCWSEGLGQLLREPEESPHAREKNHVVRAAVPREARRRSALWLAFATGLLAAFTLGVLWRSGAPIGVSNPAQRGTNIAQVIPPPTSSSPHATSAADALTLWVRDEMGNARPLRVPLVDAGTLDQQLGLQFQTGLPADVRDRLQDRGFDVQSKRRYAPLWLENGRPMIVPVEDTRIVPVSQSVY